MVYRIAGGIGLTCLGLSMFGLGIPSIVIAIALTVGGIALLAGL